MNNASIRPAVIEKSKVTIDVDVLEAGTHIEDLKKLQLKGYFGYVSVVETEDNDGSPSHGVVIYLPDTEPRDIGLKQ